MKLAWKLTLLLAVAAAGPLIAATQFTVHKSSRALRQQLEAEFHSRAELFAGLTNDYFRDRLTGLQRTLRTFELELAEDGGALDAIARVIYVQNRNVDAVAIFDDDGSPLSVVSYAEAQMTSELRGTHEPMDELALDAFRRAIALDVARRTGVAWSQPYVSKDSAGKPVPRLTVTMKVDRRTRAPYFVAVELSLRPLAERFSSGASKSSTMLLDGAGRAIIHPDQNVMFDRSDLSTAPVVLAAEGKAPGFLSAGARPSVQPWTVIVSEPESSALAPVTRQRDYARYALLLGLLAAAVVGVLAVRTVTGRLNKLRQAAAKVSAGDLDTSVDLRGRDELAELGRAFNAMTRGLKERQRLKQTFSRYVSGEIAARILSETSDLELKGEQVEVTIVFIDMRGFTSFSEQHTPHEVVAVLNTYFEEIVGAVLHHDGVINKFIGDAVVAVFGVPRAIPHPEARAMAAGVEIQRRIARLNGERRARGQEVAAFGVGINTGQAIAGNIGSAQRMEYTVIGDAVNLAQRLLGQAAAGEVIASRATVERVGDRFVLQAKGPVKVKGKEISVETYAVISDREAT